MSDPYDKVAPMTNTLTYEERNSLLSAVLNHVKENMTNEYAYPYLYGYVSMMLTDEQLREFHADILSSVVRRGM